VTGPGGFAPGSGGHLAVTVASRRRVMGYQDKAGNEAEQLKGKAKEWVGDKTDNERLEAEGVEDQASGRVKQAGEHLKDAVHDVAGD
jgi:uncharacterized protein YjbJ (UPF0337 family)